MENNEIEDAGLEKKNDDINHVDLDEQMRIAYLDYAMSVIVSRALPDARDGLKPVHRRILYAMNDMGNRWNQPHKKSARIVGEVLGKYHPHGDASIYDAMARMAQDFSMRYMLVDGQGNFGSVDGDSPAAMRYTEARMAKITDELLADIDKETIDFMDNFDGTLQEPTVLPAKVPNLLLNGSSGIAVGMATNIPPHNLCEINAALAYMIDNYDHVDDITVDDLMQFVQGPDFPTGGIIVGRTGIVQAYSTGKGHIIVRAKSTVEESSHRAGCFDIVINEIPYQVNKTTLIENIAKLVREGRIDTIHDLRDESDREGMRIVIELKKNAQPKAVLNTLYKHTALQSTFGVQMLALVKDKPEYLSLKRALEIFIEHRLEVVVRRCEFDLKKARARAHILEGLLKALDNLDEVIKIIRNAADTDDARNKLMERFDLDDVQAQAILDMQLRRLTALERSKVEDEMRQLQETIKYLNEVLESPKLQLGIVEKETDEVTQKFGDKRRTTIEANAVESLSESDLVSERGVYVTLTERGYIKRVDANTYRQYNRGAHGVTGHSLKNEDSVAKLLFVNTHDTMLFFTDRGKVYAEKVYHIDEGDRTAKGTPVINLINIESGETVTAMLALSDEDLKSDGNLIMATKNGKIKCNQLSFYKNIHSNGLKAIGLEDDDELTWVSRTDGNMDIILTTQNGKCLKYSEKLLRQMGRAARGVKAMKIEAEDRLISVCVAHEEDMLLVASEKGIGKRTLVANIPAHGRGTGGVRLTNVHAFDITGKLVAVHVLRENDDVAFITSAGNVVRLKGSLIPVLGRTAKGVRLIRMEDGVTLAAVTANDADAIKDPEEKAEVETALPESDLPEDPIEEAEDSSEDEETDEEEPSEE